MNQKTDEFKIEIETTQTLDTMLHQILNVALVAAEAEAGSIMLVDNKRGILQIKARLGKPRPGRKHEPVYKIADKNIASWVVKNKKSYLCPDIDNDQFFASSRSGKYFSSLLSVPVIHQSKVLAVINADAPEKHYFTARHKKNLEIVAKQVAKPIAERISILDALAEVGVELSRLPSLGGVEPVLEKIAQLAVRSLGADIVTLYQYIQDKDEFPVEGIGPTIYPRVKDPKPMRRKVYPGDVPWTVVKQRKSGFYSDVEKVDFLTCEIERQDIPRQRFIKREGIKSMAALLLPFRAAELKDEEVVGAMFVNYRTHHDFNIDEITALATFADYAAVAILNARHILQRRAEQIGVAESISANFAHRMSNLAGTGRVAAQILRERIDPTDSLSLRQIDRIERESSVLLDLAERISRPFKETGRIFELIPIDIIKVLKEELDRSKLDLSSMTIKKDLTQNLPLVQSVEFQLRQVFRDIISNAIEAVSGRDPATLIIRTLFDMKSNRVKVEISDNGPGIRDDIRGKLFTPGVTTKKGKLGIGLWWCRTFMQATGGDVILKDTKPEEGSTFVVEIPCVTESKIIKDELTIKDILIVDDEKEWRDQLLDTMETEKYSIDIADSYEAASYAFSTNHFKLAILDIRLVDSDPKNKDGLRLLADIDKSNLDTKVIIVTGYGTKEDEEIARQSPKLTDFIYKNKLNFLDFSKQVRKIVKGKES
jgi:signal transduction histidine kinase/CheY-like chemotaxis protein